jgi:PPOX class probable F420-dependent enzyme
MDPALDAGLRRAKYLYLTTYGPSGKPGTVPVWCWYDARHVYFTTSRDSLKARRIRRTGRVTVRVGARDGPPFEGHAELIDGRPDLEADLLRAYRRKYWLLVPLWMGRFIRRRLGTGESVLVRITPLPSAGSLPSE